MTPFFGGVLLLAACGGLVPTHGAVIELDDNSFYNYAKDRDVLLVDFYAPWCSDCKNLEPDFQAAGASLGARSIDLAKVDCFGAGKGLCTKYGVKQWPTLKNFNRGTYTGDYTGGLSAGEIAGYVNTVENSVSSQVVSNPYAAPYTPMVMQTQQCVSRCKISKITNKAPCYAKCKTPKPAVRKMLPQPVINEKSCAKCRQPQIAGKFIRSVTERQRGDSAEQTNGEITNLRENNATEVEDATLNELSLEKHSTSWNADKRTRLGVRPRKRRRRIKRRRKARLRRGRRKPARRIRRRRKPVRRVGHRRKHGIRVGRRRKPAHKVGRHRNPARRVRRRRKPFRRLRRHKKIARPVGHRRKSGSRVGRLRKPSRRIGRGRKTARRVGHRRRPFRRVGRHRKPVRRVGRRRRPVRRKPARRRKPVRRIGRRRPRPRPRLRRRRPRPRPGPKIRPRPRPRPKAKTKSRPKPKIAKAVPAKPAPKRAGKHRKAEGVIDTVANIVNGYRQRNPRPPPRAQARPHPKPRRRRPRPMRRRRPQRRPRRRRPIRRRPGRQRAARRRHPRPLTNTGTPAPVPAPPPPKPKRVGGRKVPPIPLTSLNELFCDDHTPNIENNNVRCNIPNGDTQKLSNTSNVENEDDEILLDARIVNETGLPLKPQDPNTEQGSDFSGEYSEGSSKYSGEDIDYSFEFSGDDKKSSSKSFRGDTAYPFEVSGNHHKDNSESYGEDDHDERPGKKNEYSFEFSGDDTSSEISGEDTKYPSEVSEKDAAHPSKDSGEDTEYHSTTFIKNFNDPFELSGEETDDLSTYLVGRKDRGASKGAGDEGNTSNAEDNGSTAAITSAVNEDIANNNGVPYELEIQYGNESSKYSGNDTGKNKRLKDSSKVYTNSLPDPPLSHEQVSNPVKRDSIEFVLLKGPIRIKQPQQISHNGGKGITEITDTRHGIDSSGDRDTPSTDTYSGDDKDEEEGYDEGTSEDYFPENNSSIISDIVEPRIIHHARNTEKTASKSAHRAKFVPKTSTVEQHSPLSSYVQVNEHQSESSKVSEHLSQSSDLKEHLSQPSNVEKHQSKSSHTKEYHLRASNMTAHHLPQPSNIKIKGHVSKPLKMTIHLPKPSGVNKHPSKFFHINNHFSEPPRKKGHSLPSSKKINDHLPKLYDMKEPLSLYNYMKKHPPSKVAEHRSESSDEAEDISHSPTVEKIPDQSPTTKNGSLHGAKIAIVIVKPHTSPSKETAIQQTSQVPESLNLEQQYKVRTGGDSTKFFIDKLSNKSASFIVSKDIGHPEKPLCNITNEGRDFDSEENEGETSSPETNRYTEYQNPERYQDLQRFSSYKLPTPPLDRRSKIADLLNITNACNSEDNITLYYSVGTYKQCKARCANGVCDIIPPPSVISAITGSTTIDRDTMPSICVSRRIYNIGSVCNAFEEHNDVRNMLGARKLIVDPRQHSEVMDQPGHAHLIQILITYGGYFVDPNELGKGTYLSKYLDSFTELIDESDNYLTPSTRNYCKLELQSVSRDIGNLVVASEVGGEDRKETFREVFEFIKHKLLEFGLGLDAYGERWFDSLRCQIENQGLRRKAPTSVNNKPRLVPKLTVFD